MKKEKILLIIKSFFAAWAIMRVGNLHTMNIISLLFFMMSMMFIRVAEEKIQSIPQELCKKQRLLSRITAGAFSLFYIAGSYEAMLQDLTNALFKIVISLAVVIGLYYLFYYGIMYSFSVLNGYTVTENAESAKWKKIMKFLPFITFFFCILCWLPYFLYSYPGIMTPDSINQFEQVIGMKDFSNHHPWVHTMTISLFYHLGTFFTSSVNGAFAFFTVFQMCYMAFAAAFMIWVLREFTRNKILLVGSLVFYACVPYNAVMAICIWKDVMFSGTVLIFCSAMFYLLSGKGTKGGNIAVTILYFLSGLLMCLYRTNGWYAFLLSVPFLLYAFWKEWKKMYPIHLLILILAMVVKGPVMDAYHVKQPDFVESVSIPLQQVGRVVAGKKTLTPAQEESLKKIMDIEYVDDLYVGHFADNMKELVRAGDKEYFTAHKGEYFKLWLELGFQYPGTYLAAYVNQTYGYYAPSAVYFVAEVEGIIDNHTGLYAQPLIGGPLLVKIREILIKLQNIIPIYGSLWSMASLLWATILLLIFVMGRKTEGGKELLKKMTPWIPNLAIIATLMLATPVATEFRYAYNLAYCLPLYAGIFIINHKNEM